MQYPLISEYVKAIQDAGDNLEQLAYLTPVLDDHGEPYRSSGAFAVVFKMLDKSIGKYYALKCFTEEQEGRADAYRQIADELDMVDSSYITSVKYMEKELFVDSQCEEDEFPVLLMDWVDGETMEAYIAENYQDNFAMAMLCYRFCKMAAWLRSQPFAHGDIKPDNIMVRPDGNLTLVDYDGMFVPAMKGQKSPTIGTKDFSHPLRTIDDFDETIDDFALASIALSLKVISLKPSLLDEYGAADRLLFSADDYCDLSRSKVMTTLHELINDEELATLLSMFLLVSSKKNLAMCSFRLFVGKKPELKMEIFSTEVTDEDLKDAVRDEYGVEYSKDGKKLLKSTQVIDGSYVVKKKTKIICDKAFYGCDSLSDIIIPDSVTIIGEYAFGDCGYMSNIVLPNSMTSIGNNAFENCVSLSGIVLPNGMASIGNSAFENCISLSSIVIPYGVTKMDGNPFVDWNGKLQLLSPKFIYEDGVIFDKEKTKIVAFRRNDASYIIPNGVTSIGNGAFAMCKFLSKIILPNSVTSIGNNAFWGCESLSDIVIPNSVINIGDGAFMRCESLSNIVMPNSISCIKSRTFCCCKSMSDIVIPDSVTAIEDGTFMGCVSLSNIAMPNIVSIGNEAFAGCKSLSDISIPDSLISMGSEVFFDCCSLPSSFKETMISRFGKVIFYDQGKYIF